MNVREEGIRIPREYATIAKHHLVKKLKPEELEAVFAKIEDISVCFNGKDTVKFGGIKGNLEAKKKDSKIVWSLPTIEIKPIAQEPRKEEEDEPRDTGDAKYALARRSHRRYKKKTKRVFRRKGDRDTSSR